MSGPARRRVVALGSTGSIGTQALDVARRNPAMFHIVGLTSSGAAVEVLAQQAVECGAEVIGVLRAEAVADVRAAWQVEAARAGLPPSAEPEIIGGPDASERVARWDCDVVLNGLAGAAGLLPTLAALEAGRTLALANKESLIIGGPLVKALARPGQIVPVDSEHSALAQALLSGERAEVRRLILTASGGPFRGRGRAELANVTPDQALAHQAAHHLEQGLAAGLQALEQPACLLQLVAQVAGIALAAMADHLFVAAVDRHPWHGLPTAYFESEKSAERYGQRRIAASSGHRPIFGARFSSLCQTNQ